jgi:hypothetical protein
VLHALAAWWLARNRDAFRPRPPAPVQIELFKPQPIERRPASKPVDAPARPPPHPRSQPARRASRRRRSRAC